MSKGHSIDLFSYEWCLEGLKRIIARLFSYEANDILKISLKKNAYATEYTEIFEKNSFFSVWSPGTCARGKCVAHKQKTSLAEDLSVSAERFELSTNGLKGRCSAVELRARQHSGLHSNMGNIHRQRKRA